MLEHKDGLWRRFIGSAGHSASSKRKTLVNKTLTNFQKHSEQAPLQPRQSHFDSKQIQEELLEITGEHKALSPALEKPKSIASTLGLTGRCLDTHHRTARADHRKGLNRWFGQADDSYDQYLQERINTIKQVPYVDQDCIVATTTIELPDYFDEPQDSFSSTASTVVFATPSAPLMELVSDIPELEDLLARLQMLEGAMQNESMQNESLQDMATQETAPEVQSTSLHLVEDRQRPRRRQKKLTRKQRTKLKLQQQQQQETALSAV